MCTEVKFFSERNPVVIGAVGAVTIASVTIGALQYDKLPVFQPNNEYSAYFSEIGGLKSDDPVRVSGYRVGQVSGIAIDGSHVVVRFKVDDSVRLGDRTEAAIKARTTLGAKVLDLTPQGGGQLSAPIPVERTTAPYHLPEALGELAQTISGLNTRQISDSLATLAETFSHTPPSLKEAAAATGRFADTLNQRDAQLRSLLANANKATAVLADRTGQVVDLIADTNALLTQLQTQSAALDSISHNVSSLAKQVSGLVSDNRDQLHGALDKLNGVIGIVQKNKEAVQKSIKMLNDYQMSLGEAASSGPFFKGYIANLLPGQLMQPFIDAAFSDLGLDPNVLLPSELSDPQTGQRATPALPVPYPRTGQGGEPRLTVEDAITGKPGDPRYPYREPPPAPPPGGPPPGPPAIAPPSGQTSTTDGEDGAP
ncbi:mammalian cell entry protein [Mycolicibacterium elephantis]|uniref:MCE family protein n=1 Tax=Mycolicibacterium elephantis TaxID=81858 RepID=UPI0007E9E1A2|nr:MCE family protein [Mycolicibacterium elephantis]OBE94928.1 mammalian cell entry protein [Mycolicibacterium elephantis]